MDLGFNVTLENPKEHASVFSRLFIGWVIPLIKRGVKQGLQLEDLYKTLKKDKSQNLTDTLEVNWEDEIRKAHEKKRKPSLIRPLFKQFYVEALLYGVMWFYTNVIIVCLRPIILAQLIKLFSDRNVNQNYEMYVYSVALIVVSFLSTMSLHHMNFAMQVIGMRVRVATSSLVYRKITRLSQKSLGQTAAGKVVNLLSNDLSRFDLAFPVIHALWVMPFQVVVIFLIIWQQVGISAVAGVATMVLVTVPLQGFLAKYVAKLRVSVSKKTDTRVKLMSEIVSGIQVIKMYAWEKPFEKLVKFTRSSEMKDINSASFLRGIYASSTVFSDKLSLFTTLLTFVLLGNIISADKVFSIAQSFGILQLAMAVVYPLAISIGAEAMISIRRLEEFLSLEEREEEDIIRAPRYTGITISYVDASWTDMGCTLEDINIKIPPGALCAVVGPVGAGKSSLLQLLIGELPPLSGGIEIGGEISYSAQQPWLFQSTVRNNILFGNHYDKNLYKKVVQVCALENDFEQLPHGDRTIVGEKGVSLSGGQRARINLARAVYRKADIYLLDDPLSAVDTHVGKHLFNQCIHEYLRGKTRILVTHQLQYLKKADMIIVLNDGIVEAQGTFEELSECNLDFTKILVAADETEECDKKDVDKDPPRFEAPKRYSIVSEEAIRKFSIASSTKMSLISASDSDDSETGDNRIPDEKSGDGPNSKPFQSYLKAAKNNSLVIFVIILLLSSQALIVGIDQWLTLWTTEEQIRHSNDTIFIQPKTYPNITNYIVDYNEDSSHYNIDGTFYKNKYPDHRNISNGHYYYYRLNSNNESKFNNSHFLHKRHNSIDSNNSTHPNSISNKDNIDKQSTYNKISSIENDDSLKKEHRYFDINKDSTENKNSPVNNYNNNTKIDQDFIDTRNKSTKYYNHSSKTHDNIASNKRSSLDNNSIDNEITLFNIDKDSTRNKNYVYNNHNDNQNKDNNNFSKNHENSTNSESGFSNIDNASPRSQSNFINKEDEGTKYNEIFFNNKSTKNNEIFNNHNNSINNEAGSPHINNSSTRNNKGFFNNSNNNINNAYDFINKEDDVTKYKNNFFNNHDISTTSKPDFSNNIGSTKNNSKNPNNINGEYDFMKKVDKGAKYNKDFFNHHGNSTTSKPGLSNNIDSTNNNSKNSYNTNGEYDFIKKEDESTKYNKDFFNDHDVSTTSEPGSAKINNVSTKNQSNFNINDKYKLINKEDEGSKYNEDFSNDHDKSTTTEPTSTNNNNDNTNKNITDKYKFINKEDQSTKYNKDSFHHHDIITTSEPGSINIYKGTTKNNNDDKYKFINKDVEGAKYNQEFLNHHDITTTSEPSSTNINKGSTKNNNNDKHKFINKEDEVFKHNKEFFNQHDISTTSEPGSTNINKSSTKNNNNDKYKFINKEVEGTKYNQEFLNHHNISTTSKPSFSNINSGSTNNNINDKYTFINNKEGEGTKYNQEFLNHQDISTTSKPSFSNINSGSTNNNINDKYKFINNEDEGRKHYKELINHQYISTTGEPGSTNINKGSTNNKSSFPNKLNDKYKLITKEDEGTKYNNDFSKNHAISTTSEPGSTNINNGSTINQNKFPNNINEKYEFINKERQGIQYNKDFFNHHGISTTSEPSSSNITNDSSKNNFPNNIKDKYKFINKGDDGTKYNKEFFNHQIYSTSSEPSLSNINNGSTKNNNNEKYEFINKEDKGTKYNKDFSNNLDNSTFSDHGTSTINNDSTKNKGINIFDNKKNNNDSTKNKGINIFDNKKNNNYSFHPNINHINGTGNITANTMKNIVEKLHVRNILSFETLNFNNMYDYVIVDGSVERLFKTDTALYIYGTMNILLVLLVLSRTFTYFTSCMLASENLHSLMFNKLLKAPMRFFDTNPSGRILNRFSKDIGCIDEILPRVLLDSISIFLVMAGILINIVIASPIMIIAIILLGSVYLKFRTWYMVTAKTLKHIEGIAKSPVFSHVSSTLCGIITIRASQSEDILINEFDRHQDVHTSAWYLTLACMNAFGLWLDLIVLVFLAIVTFSFVILTSFINVNGSKVGLAISQCMVLTGMLQYGMKQLAEVINNLTSVERVLQYSTIENEGPFDTPKDKKPKGTWPRRGNIEFKNLYLKYVQNEPPVLKNLNILFKPGEKIGIVGRTGAGKSSLISALFRLAPLEGSVLIDRVDTNNLGLTDLRRNISIIPQEPVLFSETLRYNLDPFGEFDDDKIWDTLELVELKESLDSLDFVVAEGGANFSLGQRQLICLARAILKENKILVLDEATANVDHRTDSLIQATIRKVFKDCTVLTIAHRLNTIMDSDKVLVMSFGNMVEFDHPHNLLQIEDGYFHKMVLETSPTMAQELKNVAQKAYEKYVAEKD